jgi:hypothetical protein
METTTVGIFGSTTHAEMAISELKDLGVRDTDISYVYNTEGTTVKSEEGAPPVAEGVAAGASTGAIIGGIAGLAVANGILPGLGPLLVAGPIAAALGLTGAAATTAAGALTGAAAGGLVGALGSLGMSSEEAKIYEERVRLGGVLLTAHSTQPEAVREIFRKHDAEEIREFGRV